jgi:predicted transcriptional regulator of viral defense system
MDVKKKQKPIEKLREILIEQNGMLYTSDLAKLGISRTYLSILEAGGEIQRISRGSYSAANTIADEMAGLQSRYKRAIFSHETALYLWKLTDRTPLFYSVTVPTGYNATSLKTYGAKVYFVNRNLHLSGASMAKTPNECEAKTYDLERTICDVLRSRNQMDIQFVNDALKRYVRIKKRNIDLLYSYAEQFRIQKIVKTYFEVLL